MVANALYIVIQEEIRWPINEAMDDVDSAILVEQTQAACSSSSDGRSNLLAKARNITTAYSYSNKEQKVILLNMFNAYGNDYDRYSGLKTYNFGRKLTLYFEGLIKRE